MQSLLTVEGWFLLIYVDCLMRFRSFRHLYAVVRECVVRPQRDTRFGPEQLSHAIDIACVLYFKPVLCLQRSASLTILLRRYGWHGEMVLGAQLLPFCSHAWVEIGNQIVNDKPYIKDTFQVLERC